MFSAEWQVITSGRPRTGPSYSESTIGGWPTTTSRSTTPTSIARTADARLTRGPRSGADEGREVLAGEGGTGGDEVGGCALEADGAARRAGAGAEVDDVVGGRDRLRLVLHDASTVLPLSRSRSSRSFIRWMSWGCRPVVGSSKT